MHNVMSVRSLEWPKGDGSAGYDTIRL